MARSQLLAVVDVHCERGDVGPADSLLAASAELRDSDNPQLRAGYASIAARVLRAHGRYADALAAAAGVLPASSDDLDVTDSAVKLAVVEAVEAALALGDLDRADELLGIPESLEPGRLTPFLDASARRLRARLELARGNDDGVEERFRGAAASFRELGFVFHLAATELEYGEWLLAQGRRDDAEALLAEARETFERLRARPWLERLAAVAPAGDTVPA